MKTPAAFAPERVLHVRQHDWPLRWFVDSETEAGEPHLVDLGLYNGNGRCSCLHFSCRLEPELRQGRYPSNATRCKHIKAARGMFCDVMVRHHTQSSEHTGTKTK